MPPTNKPIEEEMAQSFLVEMSELTQAARDNLLVAKVNQVHVSNKSRGIDPAYKVGETVMLTIAHC